MGCWNINIQGVGAHHNTNYDKDANVMAQKFVNELRAAGHHVESATFTHGGKDEIMPNVDAPVASSESIPPSSGDAAPPPNESAPE